MHVSLVDFTGNGSANPARHAANLRVFTKSTRLKMTPDLFGDIQKMSDDDIHRELAYMANTIPSSWEFVNYTFLLQDVTRAFTHQLVRTRNASYAQQTMRILDMSSGPGWTYETGPSIKLNGGAEAIYDGAMQEIAKAYKLLIDMGCAIEDARGILPTNIHTNIVMQMNLRGLVELSRKRASHRVQGEYRAALAELMRLMVDAHPWVALFLERTQDVAARELYDAFKHDAPHEQMLRMSKLLDQVRGV